MVSSRARAAHRERMAQQVTSEEDSEWLAAR
jgi:hypothetical protein